MFKLPHQIFLCSIASAMLVSALPMMVLIGGLIGKSLAPSTQLATLPISAMVLGIALGAIPTAMLIRKVGRKKAFLLGVLIALVANLVAITALSYQSFTLWMIASFLVGSYCSIAMQMRFIVSEYVPVSNIPSALSLMMLGGIVAAFIGPELGSIKNTYFQTPFIESFIGLSILQLVAAMLMLCLTKPSSRVEYDAKMQDATIAPQRWKLIAITSSVTAYGIMSYVMTATPISMHGHHGFGLDTAKQVIQWHIVAMYLPALFLGRLIERFGEEPILATGVLCYLLTFAISISGLTLAHFAIGLVFLGFGWNMMFTVGSTMVAKYDRTHKLQGVHDFCTYSIQGLTTFLAGLTLESLGWHWVLLSAILALGPYIVLLLLYARRSRTKV